MADPRPWMLVGPWYRWPGQGVPARQTRPAFQKYETTGFVEAFLKDPQRSLKFLDEDFVHRLEWLPPLPPLGGPLAGRRRRLSERTLVRTDLRKIFQAVHKRFYLVVCELHRDAPGFPCVNRQDACEAGFVIRRRRVEFDWGGRAPVKEATREAASILRGISTATAHLAQVRGMARRYGEGKEVASAESGRSMLVALSRQGEEVSAAVDRERERLAAWTERIGGRRVLEGWVPSAVDSIGSWQEVSERPASVGEAVYPLYPLVPDPRDPDHAGRARTIYFGVLPTASAEAEEDGTARFDDRTVCEVRCFVRRHDPRCPKQPGGGDCKGELVWSEATEPYRLAPHFDLTGTGKRPVTIQLPDLPALEAQAAVAKPSELATVRMVAPSGSSFVFSQDGKIPTSGSMSSTEEICSFSIPLITIVATFVFKLFLPIVVFVFNLWFLLKLKFCIPPSAEVSANVAAELALVPPQVAAGADIDVALGASASASLQARLAADFDAELGAGVGAKLTSGAAAGPGFTNRPLLRLHQELAADHGTAGQAPSFTADLEYEERVEPSEVATW